MPNSDIRGDAVQTANWIIIRHVLCKYFLKRGVSLFSFYKFFNQKKLKQKQKKKLLLGFEAGPKIRKQT